MCHLIRQQQAAPERDSVRPPGIDRLRARWVGAAGAALVGGLAVAALVAPPLASSDPKAAPAAPMQIQSSTEIVPTAALVEPGPVGIDDGVPTSSDVAKAGKGHCSHGM